MATTINHQTNDISATSGSLTIDGAAVGGGASLGVVQNWTSPAKTPNTTYQNTTGKPIFVSVELATFNYGSINLYVAATTGGLFNNRVSSFSLGFMDSMGGPLNGSFYGTVQAIVPDGFYYHATASGFFVDWWELA